MSMTITTNGSAPHPDDGDKDKPTHPQAQAQIPISQLAVESILVPIVGTAPLIVNRFSEKAKRQMLDSAQGRKAPKTPKDPEAEFKAALYRFPDDGGYGFPVIAFKAATVSAARFYDKSVTMTALRQSIFVIGPFGVDGVPLARIEGEPVMREDVTRVGNGGTDLRYRPEFPEGWKTQVQFKYFPNMLTRDSLLSLIDAGGLGVGVGDWRPERSGVHGTYRVDPDRDIEILEA